VVREHALLHAIPHEDLPRTPNYDAKLGSLPSPLPEALHQGQTRASYNLQDQHVFFVGIFGETTIFNRLWLG